MLSFPGYDACSEGGDKIISEAHEGSPHSQRVIVEITAVILNLCAAAFGNLSMFAPSKAPAAVGTKAQLE